MPTFAEPFEMLEACHERLHRTLALLARLRGHLPQHGADEQARQAAKDIMKYFDQAAPPHHQDEELHVFPRLLAEGDPAKVRTVRKLQQEHEQMESGWVRTRAVLDAIARGELQALSAQQSQDLDNFASLYAEHIIAEESIAYPAVRPMLDAATLRSMGEEMASRRGVKLP